MGSSAIEWCDDTANIQSGCTEARRPDGSMDPACVHCYARTLSGRLARMGQDLYVGATTGTGAATKWAGDLQWEPDLLDARIDAIRGRKITFLGSMTDLWHEHAERGMWARLAEAMRRIDARPLARRPWGVPTLTKRADRLLAFQREFFPEGLPAWWWPGVTVSDQVGADLRMDTLRAVRAHGPRIVSYEPAMGPVRWDGAIDGIGWLIAGGESGAKARPSHPDWFRAARDAAKKAGAAFFFKQWGEWAPEMPTPHEREVHTPRWIFVDADGTAVWRIGKATAGRVLDGRTWEEVPNV